MLPTSTFTAVNDALETSTSGQLKLIRDKDGIPSIMYLLPNSGIFNYNYFTDDRQSNIFPERDTCSRFHFEGHELNSLYAPFIVDYWEDAGTALKVADLSSQVDNGLCTPDVYHALRNSEDGSVSNRVRYWRIATKMYIGAYQTSEVNTIDGSNVLVSVPNAIPACYDFTTFKKRILEKNDSSTLQWSLHPSVLGQNNVDEGDNPGEIVYTVIPTEANETNLIDENVLQETQNSIISTTITNGTYDPGWILFKSDGVASDSTFYPADNCMFFDSTGSSVIVFPYGAEVIDGTILFKDSHTAPNVSTPAYLNFSHNALNEITVKYYESGSIFDTDRNLSSSGAHASGSAVILKSNWSDSEDLGEGVKHRALTGRTTGEGVVFSNLVAIEFSAEDFSGTTPTQSNTVTIYDMELNGQDYITGHYRNVLSRNDYHHIKGHRMTPYGWHMITNWEWSHLCIHAYKYRDWFMNQEGKPRNIGLSWWDFYKPYRYPFTSNDWSQYAYDNLSYPGTFYNYFLDDGTVTELKKINPLFNTSDNSNLCYIYNKNMKYVLADSTSDIWMNYRHITNGKNNFVKFVSPFSSNTKMNLVYYDSQQIIQRSDAFTITSNSNPFGVPIGMIYTGSGPITFNYGGRLNTPSDLVGNAWEYVDGVAISTVVLDSSTSSGSKYGGSESNSFSANTLHISKFGFGYGDYLWQLIHDTNCSIYKDVKGSKNRYIIYPNGFFYNGFLTYTDFNDYKDNSNYESFTEIIKNENKLIPDYSYPMYDYYGGRDSCNFTISMMLYINPTIGINRNYNKNHPYLFQGLTKTTFSDDRFFDTRYTYLSHDGSSNSLTLSPVVSSAEYDTKYLIRELNRYNNDNNNDYGFPWMTHFWSVDTSVNKSGFNLHDFCSYDMFVPRTNNLNAYQSMQTQFIQMGLANIKRDYFHNGPGGTFIYALEKTYDPNDIGTSKNYYIPIRGGSYTLNSRFRDSCTATKLTSLNLSGDIMKPTAGEFGRYREGLNSIAWVRSDIYPRCSEYDTTWNDVGTLEGAYEREFGKITTRLAYWDIKDTIIVCQIADYGSSWGKTLYTYHAPYDMSNEYGDVTYGL